MKETGAVSAGGVARIAVIIAIAAAIGGLVWHLTDELKVGLTVWFFVGLAGACAWLWVSKDLYELLKPAVVGPASQRVDYDSWDFRDLKSKEERDARKLQLTTNKLLNERHGQLQLRTSLRLWRAIWLIAGSGVVAVMWWLWRVLNVDFSGWDLGFASFFVVIFILGFLFTRARLKEMNGDFQATEYEFLVLSLEGTHQRTAASLFFKHQFELKRYYDQNLRQNGQVFALGTLCVLAGLATIAGAAALIALNGVDTNSGRIAVAFLGAVGGLLSGGVAMIFIRMYVGTGTALREFHRRLVITNRLHFGNLLTAMVPNTRKRERLTAQLVAAASTDEEVSYLAAEKQ